MLDFRVFSIVLNLDKCEPDILQMFNLTVQPPQASYPPQISSFCFPEGYSISSTPIDSICYSFSLVNSNGIRTYATSLLFWVEYFSDGSETCRYFVPLSLCVLSQFPAFDTFEHSLKSVLSSLQLQDSTFNRVCSLDFRNIVTSETEKCRSKRLLDYEKNSQNITPWLDFPIFDFSISRLFDILEPQVAISCTRAILGECKMIFHSSQVSLLNFVTESLLALCFPFTWSHIFIPLLPKSLLSIVQAPVPFIVGVHTAHVSGIIDSISGTQANIAVIDIDKSEISFQYLGALSQNASESIIPRLPNHIRQSLILSLRKVLHPELFLSDRAGQSVSKDSTDHSDSSNEDICAVFSKSWHLLLQGYREYLMFYNPTREILSRFHEDSEGRNIVHQHNQDVPVFDTMSFLEHVDSSSREFLSFFCGTQLFANFIEAHKSSSNLLYV